MTVVRIQKQFPKDLQQAIDFYETVSESIADRFCQTMDGCLTSIEFMPESYPLLRNNVRGVMVKPFPWMILFEVRKEAIIVLRLVHLSSDW